MTPEWFDAARAADIGLVRLAADKWKGSGRDFLIGDASDFRAIPAADLERLRTALDWASTAGIRVVLTMLSLPGARWRQNNGRRFDFSLWQDERFHEAAARFWRELAGALHDHPAIAGYNLLNEPCPERMAGFDEEQEDAITAWQKSQSGSVADLMKLYRRLAAAIRKVDTRTTLVLDAGMFASPYALGSLEPLDDPNTLYSFHMYEPYRYTNWKQNGGKLRYPSPGETAAGPLNRQRLESILGRAAGWQSRHGLPADRILLGEFGCARRVPGAAEYLADVVSLANRAGWHWCFYSFREDEWDGMDYEIGSRPLPASYWQAVERGESIAPPRDSGNPLWKAIRRGLAER